MNVESRWHYSRLTSGSMGAFWRGMRRLVTSKRLKRQNDGQQGPVAALA
ncbi:hypothetical protein OKW42_000644 [Paraburkholderia sp. WC7.3d]